MNDNEQAVNAYCVSGLSNAKVFSTSRSGRYLRIFVLCLSPVSFLMIEGSSPITIHHSQHKMASVMESMGLSVYFGRMYEDRMCEHKKGSTENHEKIQDIRIRIDEPL